MDSPDKGENDTKDGPPSKHSLVQQPSGRIRHLGTAEQPLGIPELVVSPVESGKNEVKTSPDELPSQDRASDPSKTPNEAGVPKDRLRKNVTIRQNRGGANSPTPSRKHGNLSPEPNRATAKRTSILKPRSNGGKLVGESAATRQKQSREARREAIKKFLDTEKLKADIYRDIVGRRNAFDLGKAKRRAQAIAAQRAAQQKNIPHNSSSQPFKPPVPGAELAEPELQAVAKNPEDAAYVQHVISKLGCAPKRPHKKGVKLMATMGLTADQVLAFREVFDLFDSNGGGTIDAEELDGTLRSINICLGREEIEEVLKMIDKDGNGEIDFPEFLQLMTNTERFLESLADGHPENHIPDLNRNVREHLLFDALTEFMKKSALHSMDEIVGYYHTKYKRVQTPHVVNHYAAGARLIGLNEKQLKEHLENLKATNTDANLKSPYAQPLHIVASTTNLNTLHMTKQAKDAPKRGFIRLKVKLKGEEGSATAQPPEESSDSSIQRKEKPTKVDQGELLQPIHIQPRRREHGWMSQRTEHIEVRLPPVYLKNLMPFDALTAEDLPTIRTYVNQAAEEYKRGRRSCQLSKNLKLWKSLDAGMISPPILRKHFRVVFSNYSAIEKQYLI